MSTSKYFATQTRPITRSAGLKALSLLTTQRSKTSRRKHVKIEYTENKQSQQNQSTKNEESHSLAKRSKSSDWAPEGWREQLDNIKIMRENRDAPVDLMGCERTADMKARPEV